MIQNVFNPGDLVVVSSIIYHSQRPDLIVGLVTSQIPSVQSITDWLLQGWAGSGLKLPSLFRAFLYTVPQSEVFVQIGKLSQRD